MDLTAFQKSISAATPPADASVHLQALWYGAKGNWQKGHELIQDLPDKNAAWIHAYFHRKEGDLRNADYWYKRAGKTRPAGTLQEKWEALVQAFL